MKLMQLMKALMAAILLICDFATREITDWKVKVLLFSVFLDWIGYPARKAIELHAKHKALVNLIYSETGLDESWRKLPR